MSVLVLQLLIKANSSLVHSESLAGETALFRAARLGHGRVVGFLLENEANPLHCNHNLETALEIAGVWENKLVRGVLTVALSADYLCLVSECQETNGYSESSLFSTSNIPYSGCAPSRFPGPHHSRRPSRVPSARDSNP